MKRIIGVTVGTPISPARIDEALKPVKTVNGVAPDARGNVEVIGNNGKDGKDGYTPIKGVDYFDGKDGKDGINGKDGYTPKKGVDYFDGTNGKDGYSPVRGTDYWTDADKAEMVTAVISALPVYGGETE